MPKMRGFLRSRPTIDEADWAIAQMRTAARLDDLFPPDEAPSAKETPSDVAAVDSPTVADPPPVEASPGPWAGGPRPPIVVIGVSDVVSVLPQGKAVPPIETARTAEAIWVDVETRPATSEASPGESDRVEPIGVMARVGERVADDTWLLHRIDVPDPGFAPPTPLHLFPVDLEFTADVAPREEEPVEPAAAEPSGAMELFATVEATAAGSTVTAAEPTAAEPTTAGPSGTVGPAVPGPSRAKRSRAAAVPAGQKAKRRPAARHSGAGRATATATATPARRATRTNARTVPAPPPVPVRVAHCPYCAKLLEPAPTMSRRCDRCRQRIIVKRVDGAAFYLTEAAVLVFEGERRRVKDSVRWMRERDHWLRLAATAGAPAARQAQLAGARLSEDVVKAARTLYLTTVDRSFRTARNDRDWDGASRLRRDKAAVLFRVAGSPLPPPADVVAIFREGVAAELRGVAEISRDAELVSASCCEICRADDRVIVRIAQELRAPRLPHAGCPKGLCRCHWDLATRDRLTMRRYLRRRPATDSRVDPTPGG